MNTIIASGQLWEPYCLWVSWHWLAVAEVANVKLCILQKTDGWDRFLFRIFPKEMLKRIPASILAEFYPRDSRHWMESSLLVDSWFGFVPNRHWFWSWISEYGVYHWIALFKSSYLKEKIMTLNLLSCDLPYFVIPCDMSLIQTWGLVFNFSLGFSSKRWLVLSVAPGSSISI